MFPGRDLTSQLTSSENAGFLKPYLSELAKGQKHVLHPEAETNGLSSSVAHSQTDARPEIGPLRPRPGCLRTEQRARALQCPASPRSLRSDCCLMLRMDSRPRSIWFVYRERAVKVSGLNFSGFEEVSGGFMEQLRWV